jgi:DNA-binding NarL/FixJ family response regulator
VKFNCTPLSLVYVKSILIVDDSPLIRRSLRTVFEQQPNWAVCGEAEDGYEGIEKAKILQPDLIVIDLAMPRLNGISAGRMLKKLVPATQIVMFTAFTTPSFRKAALAAGLDAFVGKSEGATSLVRSMQRLLSSELPTRSASAA